MSTHAPIRDAEDLRCAIRLQAKLIADAKVERQKAIGLADELIAMREERLEELLQQVSVPVTALQPEAS